MPALQMKNLRLGEIKKHGQVIQTGKGSGLKLILKPVLRITTELSWMAWGHIPGPCEHSLEGKSWGQESGPKPQPPAGTKGCRLPLSVGAKFLPLHLPVFLRTPQPSPLAPWAPKDSQLWQSVQGEAFLMPSHSLNKHHKMHFQTESKSC